MMADGRCPTIINKRKGKEKEKEQRGANGRHNRSEPDKEETVKIEYTATGERDNCMLCAVC